jgi:hypothetical protein
LSAFVIHGLNGAPKKGDRISKLKEKRMTSQYWLVAAMTVSMSGIALADNDCTLKTLRGTYVFTANGFTIVAGAPQPKAIVEAIDFKGDGTLSVPFSTRSVNGAVIRVPAGGTGKYTLDTSCAGTVTFDGGPSFDAFSSPNGQKVWMIQSNSDTVFEGVSEIAPRADPVCSNETLKGSYGLLLSGSRPAPSVAAGQPGFVGQFEQVYGSVVQIFDGKGNFTQVDNVKGSISGITPDRPGKGTYTVNADCSVTQIVSPAPGIQITSKGVIVDGGREFRQNTISPDAINVTAIGRQMN